MFIAIKTETQKIIIKRILKVSFAVFTIICILGVMASLKRGRLHQNSPGEEQG